MSIIVCHCLLSEGGPGSTSASRCFVFVVFNPIIGVPITKLFLLEPTVVPARSFVAFRVEILCNWSPEYIDFYCSSRLALCLGVMRIAVPSSNDRDRDLSMQSRHHHHFPPERSHRMKKER